LKCKGGSSETKPFPSEKRGTKGAVKISEKKKRGIKRRRRFH